jgi:hypothetical protein
MQTWQPDHRRPSQHIREEIMSDEKPRYGVDPYLDWIEREGLPVTEHYGVDLFSVETKPWARYGAKGLAYVKVNEVAKGREGLQSPIMKFLPDATVQGLITRLELRDGDLVFFGAEGLRGPALSSAALTIGPLRFTGQSIAVYVVTVAFIVAILSPAPSPTWDGLDCWRSRQRRLACACAWTCRTCK